MQRPELDPVRLASVLALPPPEAIEQLTATKHALATCGDPQVLAGLGQALPVRASTLAPEVCLAVHDIALALAPYRPRIPDDVMKLEPRLRVVWLRVEIAAGGKRQLDDDELLRVVTGWSLDGVAAPLPLLEQLVRAHDVRLQARVLEWLLPLVQQLAIDGQQAFACIEPLLAASSDSIRGDALRLSAKYWLLGLTPGQRHRRELAIKAALRDPAVVRAALDAAVDLGERSWLVELLEDSHGTTSAEVIEALGKLAQSTDVAMVLAIATGDLLRFGPCVRSFVLEAHRRGVFLREEHLPAILELYDEHAAWTGEELVRVTHIARARLIDLLAEVPPDDGRWIRRAAILGASLGTGAARVLERLLATTSSARIASAAIEAAGRAPEFADESALLRWLAELPDITLPTLRVKGGADSVVRLRAIVGDPFTAHARRVLAMDVLWALVPDRAELLRALAKQLGPHDSGLLESKHLARRDNTAARLLAANEWSDSREHAVDMTARLKIYCEAGDIESLPEVTRLFRELFRGYVRSALEGDFVIKRQRLPELEQLVFRYGRHLVTDGRSVRRWIDVGPETGRDLVLRIVCDWLGEDPSDPVKVALLEVAERHKPDGMMLRFIEPHWRRGDANVRRAAIQALVAAGEGVRGLELSLGKLAGETANPRIQTQALAAVRTLHAMWAEPIARAALEQPQMAVKKEAADALAVIGNANSIPALVGWLSRHDNASFRGSLQRALEHAAGPACVAVLVDALERETEPRSTELLYQALSTKLTLRIVLRLARVDGDPAHRALVDACLDRRVTIADASADELAAQVHRARLLVIEPKRDPARRLRLEGFSPEAATELVLARAAVEAAARAAFDADSLPVVRLHLADWVAWLATGDNAAAAALVLDAADKSHAEHVGALLDLTERMRIEPESVVAFVERCVVGTSPAAQMRAVAIVRALPASLRIGGLREYRLLGRLGAVRTLPDLEACLSDCRVRPDVAYETTMLLFEALQIPSAKPDDLPESVVLRETAMSWYRDPARARGWLVDSVAARPLDLPLVPSVPKPPAKPAFEPRSSADLDALVATLSHRDQLERDRAAARILAWPDARAAWARVLDEFLAERVELDRESMARLASTITEWPRRERAIDLVPNLAAWQLAAFLPAWLEAWATGDADAAALLRAVSQERLLPFVVERLKAGQFAFARLLRPSRTPAIRAIIELVREASPRDIEHLLRGAPEPDEAALVDDPVDPIAGKALDELLVVVRDKRVDKGLAVRAVHAIAMHGERSIEPLDELARDHRPPVRSAALRALRVVASKERTLEATARALDIETRRDVILSLMASIGHGRHQPSLPKLLERVVDRDYRIRQGALAALRAWGRDVIPAVRYAARRARPDHRRQYEALIDELHP